MLGIAIGIGSRMAPLTSIANSALATEQVITLTNKNTNHFNFIDKNLVIIHFFSV